MGAEQDASNGYAELNPALVLDCDQNAANICPFESSSGTYTRDRSAYVVDLLLAPEERTAFTRQGSLVQSQSRPPFNSSVYAAFSSC